MTQQVAKTLGKFGGWLLGLSTSESFPMDLKSVPGKLCLRAQPFF